MAERKENRRTSGRGDRQSAQGRQGNVECKTERVDGGAVASLERRKKRPRKQ